MKAFSLLAAALCASAALAGCFSGGKDDPVASQDQERADEILGDAGRQQLVDVANVIPKNYTFPLQAPLPVAEVLFEGTVGTSAVGSYEAEKDEGGIEYRTLVEAYDVSAQLPPGQPAEMVIDLYWDASEANSADLDIVVDVPGTKTSYSPVSETINWNYALKTMVVNTVGVQGAPATVGVQVASGVVTQGFSYRLSVRFTYVEDVLTPHHAWALKVPPGATGLVFESVKAGGDEHVTSQFIVLDPDDELVRFIDFNDINIPTESVLVPVTKAGEYVFYAYSMHGGFFRVKADVPLDDAVARPLALVETSTPVSTAPQPGVAGKDYLNGSGLGSTPADDVNPTLVDVDVGERFPLRVTGYVAGQVTTEAKIVLSSPLGVVHELTVIARYEDASGSIGYTSSREGGVNNRFHWENIAKGAWTASIVNDGPSVEIGHVVLSYQR